MNFSYSEKKREKIITWMDRRFLIGASAFERSNWLASIHHLIHPPLLEYLTAFGEMSK